MLATASGQMAKMKIAGKKWSGDPMSHPGNERDPQRLRTALIHRVRHFGNDEFAASWGIIQRILYEDLVNGETKFARRLADAGCH